TRLQGDWSSDVCSSDLGSATALGGNGSTTGTGGAFIVNGGTTISTNGADLILTTKNAMTWNGNITLGGNPRTLTFDAGSSLALRSEERRVGKGSRPRWR